MPPGGVRLPFDNPEQAKILAQFQQLNRGESMTPFEQAWSLLKNERAELRDATVAARQQGRQVPEVGLFRTDGSPRIGGQQNRLMNYPGQMFQLDQATRTGHECLKLVKFSRSHGP